MWPVGCLVPDLRSIAMNRRWLVVVVAFALGLAVGAAVLTAFHGRRAAGNAGHAEAMAMSNAASTQPKQLWTCGMHPQVIKDQPGNCPICHMKLVPMREDGDGTAATTKSATAKGERKILYWWDPMLGPSSISDKPGKS